MSTKFSTEGTANLMSINTMQYQPETSVINSSHYNNGYLEKHSESINKIGKNGEDDKKIGYAAVAWFENLYEQTGDIDGIFKMLTSDNELQTAQDIFGEETMKNTTVRLAERSLTDDYDDAIYLKNISGGVYGQTLSCDSMCKNEYQINYSSTQF